MTTTTKVDAVKWIEVSTSALRHNVREVQVHVAHFPSTPDRWSAVRAVRKPQQVIAVVKANGYGHGITLAGHAFADAGVDMLAATTPDELIALRDSGIKTPLLAFAPALPGAAEELALRDIRLTVGSDTDILTAVAAAKATGKPARVHLKIDTGMGRLGILPADAASFAKEIAAAEGVELEGVYTHFARALEPDAAPTRAQFERFANAVESIRAAGIDPGIRHCANSAALLIDPQFAMDAVRPGTILYGQYPSANVPKTLDLKDAWALKARVVAIRDIPASTAVGYGAEFVTKRASRVAILPLGFADGVGVVPASTTTGLRGVKTLARGLIKGTSETVTICGKPAPIVGRVAMQMITIDVTDIEGAAVGDIATVPARRVTASALLPRVPVD